MQRRGRGKKNSEILQTAYVHDPLHEKDLTIREPFKQDLFNFNKIPLINQFSGISGPLTDEPHERRLHALGDPHPESAERLRQHVRRPVQHRLHVRRDRALASEGAVEVLMHHRGIHSTSSDFVHCSNRYKIVLKVLK